MSDNRELHVGEPRYAPRPCDCPDCAALRAEIAKLCEALAESDAVLRDCSTSSAELAERIIAAIRHAQSVLAEVKHG